MTLDLVVGGKGRVGFATDERLVRAMGEGKAVEGSVRFATEEWLGRVIGWSGAVVTV